MMVGLEQVGTFPDPRIQVYSGGTVYLNAPHPDDINIEDIAAATSKLCRYTGHVRAFHSVAQHCVWVADRLLERTGDTDLALAGLLHDAAEAYIGDVSRPLKMLLDQLAPGVLKDVEAGLARVIAEKFGAEYPWPTIVKEMDNLALATEKRDLMPRSRAGERWPGLPRPHAEHIEPLTPDEAQELYITRFFDLTFPGV